MIKIIYYKDPVGNFGDDLNELIWPRLLPEDVRSASNVVLVGIGSLLDHGRLCHADIKNQRVYVLGSGAAYGRPPEGCETWTFLAVRGRLTERLIDRPGAAITDGAALLARIPDLIPRAEPRNDTLFMPHFGSVADSNWKAAAEQAGLTFVDPRWQPQRILAHFARAKLVVTEAMHGAIVADTLRIPWIPVVISPQISVFKWRDWLSSLDLPYEPIALPAAGRLETIKHERVTRLTKTIGGSQALVRDAALDEDVLLTEFLRRYRKEPKAVGRAPVPGGIRRLANMLMPVFDTAQIAAASKALQAAAASRSYLSSETVFSQRLEGLESALERFITEIRAG